MSGFFSTEETSANTRLPTITGCGGCGLHSQCNSPKIKSSGLGEKKILIIAESPSFEQDDRNDLGVGNATHLLGKALRKHRIDLQNDCLKICAVSCYVGEDKHGNPIEITSNQINFCRPRVWKTIKEFKPKLIILLGNAAVESFLGHRWKKDLGGITKWRGFQIPDREVDCWVLPTFHPSYVLSQGDKNPAINTVFTQDIAKAVECLDKAMPVYVKEKNCIEIVADRSLKKLLSQMSKSFLGEISWDIETTGLKPHAEGHRIVTCSIATHADRAYSFNMPTDTQTLNYFHVLMENQDIKKIAHNCFSGDTKFISRSGLFSFKEAQNTIKYLWTKKGWVRSKITNFGKSTLSTLTVVPYNRSRSSITHDIHTTRNHRWLVRRKFGSEWRQLDGYTTTDKIHIGDLILSEIPKYTIDEDSEAFKHGLIFADGSENYKKNGYQIRLCGWKEKYKKCFPKYTYPPSAKGDPVVNFYKSKRKLKELPPVTATAAYIANFIEAWNLLDGTDSTAGGSRVITTIHKNHADWLFANASVGGWLCTGISKHIMGISAFSKKENPYYMIILTKDTAMAWTVRDLQLDSHYEDVFCAEVPEIGEFTLQHGIYTGNCKFENCWVKELYNIDVQGWDWDTMQVAHILDNRRSITGLKVQAYLKFGLLPYDEHIEPFLKGLDDKDGNSMNRILEAPRQELLTYNAYDSLLTHRLWELQKKEMRLMYDSFQKA